MTKMILKNILWAFVIWLTTLAVCIVLFALIIGIGDLGVPEGLQKAFFVAWMVSLGLFTPAMLWLKVLLFVVGMSIVFLFLSPPILSATRLLWIARLLLQGVFAIAFWMVVAFM